MLGRDGRPAVTDFPDIRVKSAISSSNDGSVLIIPREGGYLVRFYVGLDEIEAREVTPEKLAEAANRILHPYKLEVKDVGWWPVYEVGQRLCDKFDDVPAEETATRLPRVFIAGDACHTHSWRTIRCNADRAELWQSEAPPASELPAIEAILKTESADGEIS